MIDRIRSTEEQPKAELGKIKVSETDALHDRLRREEPPLNEDEDTGTGKVVAIEEKAPTEEELIQEYSKALTEEGYQHVQVFDQMFILRSTKHKMGVVPLGTSYFQPEDLLIFYPTLGDLKMWNVLYRRKGGVFSNTLSLVHQNSKEKPISLNFESKDKREVLRDGDTFFMHNNFLEIKIRLVGHKLVFGKKEKPLSASDLGDMTNVIKSPLSDDLIKEDVSNDGN